MLPSEAFWRIFGLVGIVAICAVLFVFAYSAFDSLRSVIRQWRWNYKYKHRLDKPPTAACYCKDCIYHGTTYKDGGNNKCDYPGIEIWTPDEGFCFEAEPINAQEAKKRGQ